MDVNFLAIMGVIRVCFKDRPNCCLLRGIIMTCTIKKGKFDSREVIERDSHIIRIVDIIASKRLIIGLKWVVANWLSGERGLDCNRHLLGTSGIQYNFGCLTAGGFLKRTGQSFHPTFCNVVGTSIPRVVDIAPVLSDFILIAAGAVHCGESQLAYKIETDRTLETVTHGCHDRTGKHYL